MINIWTKYNKKLAKKKERNRLFKVCTYKNKYNKRLVDKKKLRDKMNRGKTNQLILMRLILFYNKEKRKKNMYSQYQLIRLIYPVTSIFIFKNIDMIWQFKIF